MSYYGHRHIRVSITVHLLIEPFYMKKMLIREVGKGWNLRENREECREISFLKEKKKTRAIWIYDFANFEMRFFRFGGGNKVSD